MTVLKRLREILATPPAPREGGPTPALYDYPVARYGREPGTRTK